MTATRTSVLFVCLGNICRSPMAEGVFQRLVEDRGLTDRYVVDSAGTGSWHAGDPPDGRAVEVARRNGVQLGSVARQVTPDDFERFDWIVAMDRSNLSHLESQRPSRSGGRLTRFRAFDPEPGDGDVPDPYYGGTDGFDHVWAIISRCATSLLDHLEAERAGEGKAT